MKYLRLFENKVEEIEITKKFALGLYKFIKYFYKDFDTILKVRDNYDGEITKFEFNESIYGQTFLIIYFTPITRKSSGKEDDIIFSIRIQVLYTGIDISRRGSELERYLFELITPLCLSHDGVYEYYLDKDKLQELISLLTIEEYELRRDANKYNL